MVSRSNLQPTHSNSAKGEAPLKPCMWKLLAAAGAILAGLGTAIAFADHSEQAGYSMSAAPHVQNL